MDIKGVFTGSECKDWMDVPGPVLFQVSQDIEALMMCYIIKTKNNKLIVVDGGGISPGNRDKGYLYGMLQKMSGKEIPEVEAWFLSHLHDDHLTELALIALDPEKKIKINKICFNFPSREFMGVLEKGTMQYLFDDMRNSYNAIFGEGAFEAIDGKSVKTGDEFDIDGIKVNILLTYDINEVDTNINDTSMIFSLEIEGQKVLFLGDSNIRQGNRLIQTQGDNAKAPIVQMAHHGQSGVSKETYEAIGAKMCLWPTPNWVYDNRNGNLQTLVVRQWMMDMGVKYHMVIGLNGTQGLTFPVDFDKLDEVDVTP